MQTIVKKLKVSKNFHAYIYLLNNYKQLSSLQFPKENFDFIKYQHDELEKDLVIIHDFDSLRIFQFLKDEGESYKIEEKCRKAGDKITEILNENKIDRVLIKDICDNKIAAYSLAEGMALGNYQFVKYKTEQKNNSLGEIYIDSNHVNKLQYEHLNILIDAVYKCRDLVNEPLTYLNAVSFSEIITQIANEVDVKVDVFNK